MSRAPSRPPSRMPSRDGGAPRAGAPQQLVPPPPPRSAASSDAAASDAGDATLWLPLPDTADWPADESVLAPPPGGSGGDAAAAAGVRVVLHGAERAPAVAALRDFAVSPQPGSGGEDAADALADALLLQDLTDELGDELQLELVASERGAEASLSSADDAGEEMYEESYEGEGSFDDDMEDDAGEEEEAAAAEALGMSGAYASAAADEEEEEAASGVAAARGGGAPPPEQARRMRIAEHERAASERLLDEGVVDAQMVRLVRAACGVGAEECCHGAFRCGLAARRRAPRPPPLPPSVLLPRGVQPQHATGSAQQEAAQDELVMGRLFVFDSMLCFRATHPYAFVHDSPFIPRMYKFVLWHDVAAVAACRVVSAPHAALALYLRAPPPAAAGEAEAEPFAVLYEFSSTLFGEEDAQLVRNGLWRLCYDRLRDAAARAAAEAAATTEEGGPAAAADALAAQPKRAPRAPRADVEE